jgi:microcystin degradation protein MlrC
MLRVNTPGITSADMTSMEFHHRRKPLFPFEL